HDAIPERLAAPRKGDLLARRQRLPRRGGRRVERQPRVAADTPVPPHSTLLAHDDRIFRPDPRDVGAEQLVPGEPADDQLPVELRPEPVRLLCPRRLLHSAMLLGWRSVKRAAGSSSSAAASPAPTSPASSASAARRSSAA